MTKVICAVLRYADDEKSLIIEHEKLRHSVHFIIIDFLFVYSKREYTLESVSVSVRPSGR
jgi:hypothetical protein